MSDAETHGVAKWLRANALASIALTITLLGATGTLAYSIIHWADTQEHQIALNKSDVIRAATNIATLQADIVSLDRRANELSARVTDLNSQSDAARAVLRSRLDVIDALSRFNTDRAFQAPLPPAPRR